ncbi:hypothetical protein HDU97_008033, partial [Phlyctochytrium planicorne]
LERVASSSSSQLEQSQTGRTSQDGSDGSLNRQAMSVVSEPEPEPRVQRREIFMTNLILPHAFEHQDFWDHSLEDSEDELQKDDGTEPKPRDHKLEIEE